MSAKTDLFWALYTSLADQSSFNWTQFNEETFMAAAFSANIGERRAPRSSRDTRRRVDSRDSSFKTIHRRKRGHAWWLLSFVQGDQRVEFYNPHGNYTIGSVTANQRYVVKKKKNMANEKLRNGPSKRIMHRNFLRAFSITPSRARHSGHPGWEGLNWNRLARRVRINRAALVPLKFVTDERDIRVSQWKRRSDDEKRARTKICSMLFKRNRSDWRLSQVFRFEIALKKKNIPFCNLPPLRSIASLEIFVGGINSLSRKKNIEKLWINFIFQAKPHEVTLKNLNRYEMFRSYTRG